MPLQRRVPKFGFKNANRVEYKPLNLDSIQALADATSVSVIDFDFMLQHGLVSKKDLVKVLSRGEVTGAIEIHAHAFSASAKEAIERAGGKAVVPSKPVKEEAAN